MIRLLNGLVFVVCLIVVLPISFVYWAVHMFRDIFKKKDVSAEELDSTPYRKCCECAGRLSTYPTSPFCSDECHLSMIMRQYGPVDDGVSEDKLIRYRDHDYDEFYDDLSDEFQDHFKKKEYCSYHPEVELTDACDGDTPTPCTKCWDDYRYPDEGEV